MVDQLLAAKVALATQSRSIYAAADTHKAAAKRASRWSPANPIRDRWELAEHTEINRVAAAYSVAACAYAHTETTLSAAITALRKAENAAVAARIEEDAAMTRSTGGAS